MKEIDALDGLCGRACGEFDLILISLTIVVVTKNTKVKLGKP